MNAKPSTAATPEEYLDAIEEPRKSDMLRLHALIRKAVPKLTPAMQSGMIGYGSYHYKYASGREGDTPLAAFSPRKRQLVLYLNEYFDEGYDDVLIRLGPHTLGKGCLYIERLELVDTRVLRELIARTVAATKAREAKANAM